MARTGAGMRKFADSAPERSRSVTRPPASATASRRPLALQASASAVPGSWCRTETRFRCVLLPPSVTSAFI